MSDLNAPSFVGPLCITVKCPVTGLHQSGRLPAHIVTTDWHLAGTFLVCNDSTLLHPDRGYYVTLSQHQMALARAAQNFSVDTRQIS